MNFKIFGATFLAIIAAEMADKTQLVGINMAAESKEPLSVFTGSVIGYALITAVSVVLGSFLGEYIDPAIIRIAGGSIFIVLGILMIWGKF
ncbi:MAG: TMEM165/GDT1 family protein [Elusimicrobiota bacterium]